MNIIGLKELRENTEKYITQVEKGRSFTVVRKSKPVFKMTPVDKWGDEGKWKTLIDFTKINKNGIDARELLRHFREFDAQEKAVAKKNKR